jgi:hypothetical protein
MSKGLIQGLPWVALPGEFFMYLRVTCSQIPWKDGSGVYYTLTDLAFYSDVRKNPGFLIQQD